MSLTKVSYSMIDGAPFNIFDFGVTGDGSTDDTTAIASAVSYLAANGGGTLYFPKGTYKYTNLEVNCSNVHIVGAGWGVTVLQPSGWCDGVRFADGYTNPTSVLFNVSIQNLTIDGVNQIAGVGDTYGNGVNFNNCTSFTCHNVQCVNVKQQQIVSTYFVSGGTFDPQASGYITDNEVDATLSENIVIGVEANPSKIIISNNIVKNSGLTNQAGIYIGNAGSLTAGGDISVVDNNITGAVGTEGVGIKIENTQQRILISSNYVYGFNVGLRASASILGGTPSNINIVGNTFENWTENGILLYPLNSAVSSQTAVTGNSLVTLNGSATANAIQVQNTTFVSSNRIYASGAASGIYLSGLNNIVSGNYVAGTTSYSIDAGTLTGATGSVILNNFTDQNINLISDTVSFGNSGYNTTQRWSENYFGAQKTVSNPNGNLAPTSGTWSQGDMVWNTLPIAGGTMGWVCVTSGTPGTWKSFGTIAV